MEMEEWHRLADGEREEKIKLQYENKFLVNRNGDLEGRIRELERCLMDKQEEIIKLRQNNIFLFREKSESKLNRSISRSPYRNEEKENIYSNRNMNIIEHLHY
jgi:hypothetical protein